MHLPMLNGISNFGHIIIALVDADNSAKAARDMVQEPLNHRKRYSAFAPSQWMALGFLRPRVYSASRRGIFIRQHWIRIPKNIFRFGAMSPAEPRNNPAPRILS